MAGAKRWRQEATAWAVMLGLVAAVAIYVWATDAYREHRCRSKGLRVVAGSAVCVDAENRVP